MPGNASGGMDGVAVKPLTVGFHENPFLGQLNQENQLAPWAMLSDEERQRAGRPWGPSNPQALNRYAYVLNNPLRWTDPTGHAIPPSFCWYCNRDLGNISGWSNVAKGAVVAACWVIGCKVDYKTGNVRGPSTREFLDASISGALPVGLVGGRGFGNIGGGRVTVAKVLDAAEKWLGSGYREIAEGVFRSADGRRQFRMTIDDLLDPRQGPHVHFEAIDANGRTIVENSHVYLIDP